TRPPTTGRGPCAYPARSGRHGHLAAVDELRALPAGPDVGVEDLRRQEERAAGVRDVEDAADPALDRRGAEDEVGLLPGVPPLLEVLDGVEAGVAVRLG